MRERICSRASSTVSIRRYSTPRCSTLEGPRSGVVEQGCAPLARALRAPNGAGELVTGVRQRSEEHTSELQSRLHLVCRLLLEKKKKLKLLKRITRTENIIHRNFTRRHVAI